MSTVLLQFDLSLVRHPAVDPRQRGVALSPDPTSIKEVVQCVVGTTGGTFTTSEWGDLGLGKMEKS